MNNSAAIGYMILAAKQIGMKEDDIKRLEGAMKEEMDFTAEEKAEETYRKF